MIDVAVTSDVREASTENVLLKPHRTIVAIEDIVMFLYLRGIDMPKMYSSTRQRCYWEMYSARRPGSMQW